MMLFFLHSVPNLNLSLGWTALIGILLLLILADSKDLDGLMARVEWSTLVFFASLFILMEVIVDDDDVYVREKSRRLRRGSLRIEP